MLPATAPTPPPAPDVRLLTPDDAPAFADLSAESAWIAETWGGVPGLLAARRCPRRAGGRAGRGARGAVLPRRTYEDIGVVTEPDHRRRGLSTACAAALVADIRARGHVPTWSTSPDNAGSRGVAARLGFVHERDDVLYALRTPHPDVLNDRWIPERTALPSARARGRHRLPGRQAAAGGARPGTAGARRAAAPAAGRARPGRAHRARRRLGRQAPVHPLRRRPQPAQPLPDGRLLAPLPARTCPGSGRPTRPARCWRPPTGSAVGFALHDLELLPTAEEDRLVGHLGPDLLDPHWDDEHAAEALRRFTARGATTSWGWCCSSSG